MGKQKAAGLRVLVSYTVPPLSLVNGEKLYTYIMASSIAHLGPAGTYTEMAALDFARVLGQQGHPDMTCHPCATIAETLHWVAEGKADWAVVPVENSIGGSVPMTLDTLWGLESLTIQYALILPIAHGLLTYNTDLSQIQTVASHPQALAQCQRWLDVNLPQATRVPMNSTTEALQQLPEDMGLAAIASCRAAELHNIPVRAYPINDFDGNCTRFWVINRDPLVGGSHTSMGFSLYANVPGALVKALQAFADRGLNMSRIESRPTKRSLGDYLFFIDIEDSAESPALQAAIASTVDITENLRVLGSYDILECQPPGSA